MSIKIYKSESVSDYADTTTARAIVDGHNKRSTQPNIRELFLRNDDPTKWMSNITVQATSTNFDVTGADGFGYKFYYGSLEPTDRVWNAIGYNVPISINNIGTAGSADTSFKRFWVRTEVAPSADVSVNSAEVKCNYVIHAV